MATKKKNGKREKVISMENWIWGAACSIRGVQDAPKFKDFILPLVFVKRLCDVYDDEISRISEKVKSRTKALNLIEKDKKLVRFYLPIKPEDPENESTWSVIRTLSDKIGQQLTDILREIAKENPSLDGIIDRIDFNATTHGQRDIDDDRLSVLIERISEKRLGLKDVEPDILGRSYEYLLRKFAEGSGQSVGEFLTPKEVGILIAKIMKPEPGMEIHDPCCGSGGLLIKCELELDAEMEAKDKNKFAPLQLYGQEFMTSTWAMSKMNMVIHDMEGEIEIGDTMKSPKFREGSKLKKFDRVVANPMWNQGRDSLSYVSDDFFINDELERFPAGSCGGKLDWGWIQHIYSCLKENGRAGIVIDTGAASRGSGSQGSNKEKDCRKWFVEHDLIEGVIYLPENLFYNTTAPGIIIFLNKQKPQKLKDKIFMIHAGNEFEKGDPKNHLTEEGIEKIAETYTSFKESEKFAQLVSKEEVVKNDYNISPSRYLSINEIEEYRPLEEIVEELNVLEEEATMYDSEIKTILKKLKI